MKRVWTDEENVFLKNNYLNYYNPKLSKLLNRSINSIKHKLSRIGLKRDQEALKRLIYLPLRTGENSPTKRLDVRKKMSLNNARAMLGTHHSKETRKKISIGNKGKSQTEEVKARIRLAHIGKKLPLEIKEKISLSNSNPSLETRMKMSMAKKGLKLTKEHKRKISEARIGKKLSENVIKMIKERRKTQMFPVYDTSIEVKIQNFLKQLGIEFFTHQYIKIEHGYQCDILIPSMHLVIECDGDYWHGNPIRFPNLTERQKQQREMDNIRTQQLIEKGFRVLRLWENEVKIMELNDFNKRLNEI